MTNFGINNRPTLTEFESDTRQYVETISACTYLAKITNATVTIAHDGTGGVETPNLEILPVVLKSINSNVGIFVTPEVSGYSLITSELYNMPKVYKPNDFIFTESTIFPDNTVALNFEYTDTQAAGYKITSSVDLWGEVYYLISTDDNRRGNVTTITTPADRNKNKAPAYATFVRLKLQNDTQPKKQIWYDIYLGDGTLTNFDVCRNHVYTITATIKGTAAYFEALAKIDPCITIVTLP